MKKSPTDGFVDIHHHLIYGLDDGAQTWEQTQQMLTQAGENGIRRIIATLIPTLAESEFVLVEFLPTAPYRELQSAAKALTAARYMPVFAHIERYRCLRWPGRVRKLKRDFSVCMQMNADTICRKHSFFSQRWVNAVIQKGYVDFAATDSHNVTSRACRMRACYRELQQRFGEQTAERLCIVNPAEIQ